LEALAVRHYYWQKIIIEQLLIKPQSRRAHRDLTAEDGTVSNLPILAECGLALPSTTLTLYGGTDHDLANSAIIEPYFSMAKSSLWLSSG
jgi:hypothetical protein